MKKYALVIFTSSYVATEKEIDYDDKPSDVDIIKLQDNFYTSDKTKEDIVDELLRVFQLNSNLLEELEEEGDYSIDDIKNDLINEGSFEPDVETPHCCDSYVHRSESSHFKLYDETEFEEFKRDQVKLLEEYIKPFKDSIEDIEKFEL